MQFELSRLASRPVALQTQQLFLFDVAAPSAARAERDE
jgi:hypothetical protein